jgi:hypothetical protein
MAQAVPLLSYRCAQKLHTHLNRGDLRIFSRFNQNVMYDVWCDILSKDGASRMNARATLSNSRIFKENIGGTVCIHGFGSLCIIGTCPLRILGGNPNILTQVSWFSSDPPGRYLDSAVNWATTSSSHILSRKLLTNLISTDSVLQDWYSDDRKYVP